MEKINNKKVHKKGADGQKTRRMEHKPEKKEKENGKQKTIPENQTLQGKTT